MLWNSGKYFGPGIKDLSLNSVKTLQKFGATFFLSLKNMFVHGSFCGNKINIYENVYKIAWLKLEDN